MSSAKKQKRSHADDGGVLDGSSAWGWKIYNGPTGFGRSCPGDPPRERFYVYQQPFSKLNASQRAAAFSVLGIMKEEAWELAMPRRIKGHPASNALTYQPQTWDDLSPEQQEEASTKLDLSKYIWNRYLAPFHDKLWTVDGLTMTSKEFSAVLSTLHKLTQQPLTKTDLVQFLLNLGRLLTPSQGRVICQMLEAGACWTTLCPPGSSVTSSCQAPIIVASFLSDPERFVAKPYLEIQEFWDDGSAGCFWGNAYGNRCYRYFGPRPPSYAYELKKRHRLQDELRQIPFILRDVYPKLPQCLAQRIVDEWIGEPPEIDLHFIDWLICYEQSIASFLPK